MTEGSRELLACPFCGEMPRRAEVSPDGCTIYCGKCAIELPLREWNTRVSRTAPDGGRDKWVEAVKAILFDELGPIVRLDSDDEQYDHVADKIVEMLAPSLAAIRALADGEKSGG